MRLIDADALMDDVMKRYCKDCDKRKGIKSGKRRIIYEIGDAPCRACSVDDMKAELENAPTIDAVPVVRCKDCKHFHYDMPYVIQGIPVLGHEVCDFWGDGCKTSENGFCSYAERRADDADVNTR